MEYQILPVSGSVHSLHDKLEFSKLMPLNIGPLVRSRDFFILIAVSNVDGFAASTLV